MTNKQQCITDSTLKAALKRRVFKWRLKEAMKLSACAVWQ